MKFRAKFAGSVAKLMDCPADGLPEIAILGRSNVGKSSLINAITERKGLAKTSSTPGKTQLLNYFAINDAYYLVDMPGYGYAKAAKSSRLEWAKLSQEYLRNRIQLRGVLLLIDSRHPELDSDLAAIEWLEAAEVPCFIALTKVDKVLQRDLARHKTLLKANHPEISGIFGTSSNSGRGLRELRKYIAELAAEDAVP